MSRDVRGEQITDPVLAAAVAELRKDVPRDVDWDGLRRSVNEQAELLLARKRTRLWKIVPRPVVPIAVAASVAFALWAGPGVLADFGTRAQPAATVAVEIDEEQLLVDALGSDLTEQEFRLLVTGRANPEALLAFAIGDR